MLGVVEQYHANIPVSERVVSTRQTNLSVAHPDVIVLDSQTELAETVRKTIRSIGALSALGLWIVFCALNKNVNPALIGTTLNTSDLDVEPAIKTAIDVFFGIIFAAAAYGTGANWSNFFAMTVNDVRNIRSLGLALLPASRLAGAFLAIASWVTFCAINNFMNANLVGTQITTPKPPLQQQILVGLMIAPLAAGFGANTGANALGGVQETYDIFAKFFHSVKNKLRVSSASSVESVDTTNGTRQLLLGQPQLQL